MTHITLCKIWQFKWNLCVFFCRFNRLKYWHITFYVDFNSLNETSTWFNKINKPEKYQITFFRSRIFNFFLSLLNLSRTSGLVNKSASWFFVLTNFISQSPFRTWSLMKWCLISICLVLECCIGFLVRLIALVLSQYKGTFPNFTQ